MPTAKPRSKKKLPVKSELFHKALMKFRSPDRKDLSREYAGRGDTHALEGGRINPLNSEAYKMRKAIQRQANLKTWEDRNRANQGTKLSK